MICAGDSGKARVISGLLNVYQFKLITVTQESEFLKQAQTHKPAIIILNEQFTGNNPVNQLRKDPALCNIPVIMISNNAEAAQIYNELYGDSLFELMQEPFKIKHLRHCVDRWTTFRSLYVKQ